jgi:hypothetical protein
MSPALRQAVQSAVRDSACRQIPRISPQQGPAIANLSRNERTGELQAGGNIASQIKLPATSLYLLMRH